MTNPRTSEVDVDESTSKKCRKCDEVKDLTAFHRVSAAADGRAYRCKTCANAARKEHYWRNRDRELEKNRAWREANPDLARELSRLWYEANREKSDATTRAWRAENRERHLAQRRRWLEANPDYYEKWNSANRERIRAASRKYKAANPEKNAEAVRKRRATECGPVDLAALWTGDCSLCGKPMDRQLKWPDPLSKSVDHTIPLSRGGTHEQANLTWAHLVCNMRKGAREDIPSPD